jgi:hypothetical protein
MSTVSHDFVSVDMRGMKAALVAHARARRLGVSEVMTGEVVHRQSGLPRGSTPTMQHRRPDSPEITR